MRASSSQTKKTRRARSNSGAVRLTHAIVITFLLAGISAGGAFLFPTAVSNIAFTVAAPFWRAQNTASVWFSDVHALIESKQSLKAENRALEARIAELNGERLALEARIAENERLRSLLNREGTAVSGMLAAVLKRPPSIPYDTLIIDRGRTDGISVGDTVRAHGTIAIGRVSEVYADTAKAVLFSSPGSETAVMIGQDRIQVTAHGRGAGNFTTQLPQGVSINAGDVIVLADRAASPFAVVEHIQAEPADPFQIIYFKNPVNLAELSWVHIVDAN